MAAPRDSAIARTLDRDPKAVTRAQLLPDPQQALASRLNVIDMAESSIDLQYFIWQNDYTGVLMVEKLLQAADRGYGSGRLSTMYG